MDHENYRAPIEIEVVFESAGTPSLKANIYRAEGFLNRHGAAVVVDSWLHVALVKTLDGVYLFRQRQAVLAGDQLQPVNRVAVGGFVTEDDTTVRLNQACLTWTNCASSTIALSMTSTTRRLMFQQGHFLAEAS